MRLFRATLNAAGLRASRLYEIDDDDIDDRVQDLIDNGILVEEPSSRELHAPSPEAMESLIDQHPAKPIDGFDGDKHGGADPSTAPRFGVPTLPPDLSTMPEPGKPTMDLLER